MAGRDENIPKPVRPHEGDWEVRARETAPPPNLNLWFEIAVPRHETTEPMTDTQ